MQIRWSSLSSARSLAHWRDVLTLLMVALPHACSQPAPIMGCARLRATSRKTATFEHYRNTAHLLCFKAKSLPPPTTGHSIVRRRDDVQEAHARVHLDEQVTGQANRATWRSTLPRLDLHYHFRRAGRNRCRYAISRCRAYHCQSRFLHGDGLNLLEETPWKPADARRF